MDRKVCAGCGQASLASDERCWACGGARFVAVAPGCDAPGAGGAPLAGEPTLHLGEAREVTERLSGGYGTGAGIVPLPQGAGYALGGTFLVMLICAGAFWAGRASAPDAPGEAAPSARLMPAGVPPAPAPTAPGSPAAPAFTGTQAAPLVSVRTQPGFPGADAGNPAAGPLHAPSTVIQGAAGRGSRDGSGPPVTVVGGAFPEAGAARGALSAPASPGVAVVTLRNDTGGSLEVTMEGAAGDTRTAMVAPRSAVPVTLAPGSYRVRARGGGLVSAASGLEVQAERTYLLGIERRRDEGSDTLALIEPAIEGAS